MSDGDPTQHCILVVEDDPDIRELEVTLLEDHGYTVAAAMNGAEALEYLRQAARPCLIVLDLMMPVMDGFEFCSERRKSEALSRIPVVIVSATPRDDPRVVGADAAGYVTKPLDLDKFMGMVERLCPGKNAHDHAG